MATVDIIHYLCIDSTLIRNLISDIYSEQIHLVIQESSVLEQVADSVPDYGKADTIKIKRGIVKSRTPNQA